MRENIYIDLILKKNTISYIYQTNFVTTIRTCKFMQIIDDTHALS